MVFYPCGKPMYSRRHGAGTSGQQSVIGQHGIMLLLLLPDVFDPHSGAHLMFFKMD